MGNPLGSNFAVDLSWSLSNLGLEAVLYVLLTLRSAIYFISST